MKLDLDYCYDFILSDYKTKFLRKYGASYDFIHIRLTNVDLVTCVDTDDNLESKLGFVALDVEKTKIKIEKEINALFKTLKVEPNMPTKKQRLEDDVLRYLTMRCRYEHSKFPIFNLLFNNLITEKDNYIKLLNFEQSLIKKEYELLAKQTPHYTELYRR